MQYKYPPYTFFESYQKLRIVQSWFDVRWSEEDTSYLNHLLITFWDNFWQISVSWKNNSMKNRQVFPWIPNIERGMSNPLPTSPFYCFRGFCRAIFFLRIVWSWFKVRWVALIQEMILDTKHVPLSTPENFLVAPEVTESLENSL